MSPEGRGEERNDVRLTAGIKVCRIGEPSTVRDEQCLDKSSRFREVLGFVLVVRKERNREASMG